MAFSNQSLLEKQSQLLSLTFAVTQNNCNELSRAALIYSSLTYNTQSSFILWLYQLWNQLFAPPSAPRALRAPTAPYAVLLQQATRPKQLLLPWVAALIKANLPLAFFHCCCHYLISSGSFQERQRSPPKQKTRGGLSAVHTCIARETRLLPCHPSLWGHQHL